MNGLELKTFLVNFPHVNKLCKGVFFIDNLPKCLKLHHFVICNTDFHSGSGKHWICFLRLKKNEIECFDSLGIDLEKKILLTKYCKFNNIKNIIFNETQFQSSTSNSCGKFVLYFIIERYFNLDLDLETLLSESFELDLDNNENIVNNFYNEFLIENGK